MTRIGVRPVRSFLLWWATCILAVVSGCGDGGDESPADLLNRAKDHLRRGNEEVALNLLNEAIARKPDFGNALWERGKIYTNRGQHEQALYDLSMAIDVLPENEKILCRFRRALLCRTLGVEKSAMARMDCDIILDHHAEEDWMRGTTFAIRAWANAAADPHKAVIEDSTAVLSNPNASDWAKVEALALRAGAFNDAGDHQRAIEDCTEAIRINPSHSALPYLTRCIAYLSTGQEEKANADKAMAERMKALAD